MKDLYCTTAETKPDMYDAMMEILVEDDDDEVEYATYLYNIINQGIILELHLLNWWFEEYFTHPSIAIQYFVNDEYIVRIDLHVNLFKELFKRRIIYCEIKQSSDAIDELINIKIPEVNEVFEDKKIWLMGTKIKIL